jgi:hypothetical protein
MHAGSSATCLPACLPRGGLEKYDLQTRGGAGELGPSRASRWLCEVVLRLAGRQTSNDAVRFWAGRSCNVILAVRLCLYNAAFGMWHVERGMFGCA